MSPSEWRRAIRQEITESYSSGEQAPPAHGRTRTHAQHAHTGYSGYVGQACEASRLTDTLNQVSDLQVSPFSTWKRKQREYVTSAVITVYTFKQL